MSTATTEALSLIAEAIGSDIGDLARDAYWENTDGWDSLAHLRLITLLEARIGRPLAGNEILDASSASGVEKLLRNG